MYVCGLTICDLFIFSPLTGGSCCIEVHRNENFLLTTVLKCEFFYFEHFLPALKKKMQTNVPSN